MTYEESAALMTDLPFRGRVKVACLKFANSIMIEASSVPAHNARLRWAQKTFSLPDQVAFEIQPPTVMDPAVQPDGAAINDAMLHGAVEGVGTSVL